MSQKTGNGGKLGEYIYSTIVRETARWAREKIGREPGELGILVLLWAYLHPAARYADEVKYASLTLKPGSPLAEKLRREIKALVAGRIAQRLLERLGRRNRSAIESCTYISLEELVVYTTSDAIDPAEAEICGISVAKAIREALCKVIAEAIAGKGSRCEEKTVLPRQARCGDSLVVEVSILRKPGRKVLLLVKQLEEKAAVPATS